MKAPIEFNDRRTIIFSVRKEANIKKEATYPNISILFMLIYF